MSKFKLAIIQLAVGSIKKDNLKNAAEKVAEAAKKGAKVVSLPECFNSPYGTKYFEKYAESIPDDTSNALSAMAKDNQVYLIGGSFPEREHDKIYNTCTVWGPDGSLLATHRKIHLFDIDIPGRITFKESETISSGNKLTVFDTPYCKIGIGICYDIRFQELAMAYNKLGCKLILYPGAFNMTTGPAHWQLLLRARAVDNQAYVACVSPARDVNASYVAWGHSAIADPWGEVIGSAEDKEDIVYADLDMLRVDDVRKMMPFSNQRRQDLYNLTFNCEKLSQ